MPIAPTPIPPFPTPPPTADDPTNFPARGDATVEWFVDGIPGIEQAAEDTYDNAVEVFNAAAQIAAASMVAVDAAGFVATSTSSLTVGAGTKTIHFDATKPKLAVATYQVAIVLASDNSIKMIGNVATTDGSDDITVTVVSGGVSGSGTYSGPWLIVAGAFLGQGATAAEMRAAVRSGVVSVSPQSISDANATTVLNWASTITPDMSAGHRRTLTASASFTMGAPTNCLPGDTFEVDITNSAGSIVLAVAAAWKRQGGLGIIGPNNADRSKFIGLVEEVSGGTMTRGLYAIVRTPT